jgi:phospholipid/cholesterol/gamma-HCH transport system substrate-binding protein
MREVARNFTVGLTTILALGGLTALLMLFGELDRWVASRYAVTLLINDAGGLSAGSQVLLNGVRVGMVESVSVQQDPDFPVTVTALIDRSVLVPSDVIPRIEMTLIGASATLWLKTPPFETAQPRAFLSTDGTAILTGHHRSMIEEITAGLDERMGSLVSALDNFEELSATYLELGRNLNDLVRPMTAADQAGGADPNIRSAVAKLNTALDDAQEALRLAKDWLGDEQIRADARSAVSKANTLIEKATTTFDRYAALADTMELKTDELIRTLNPVAEEMNATLIEVRRLAQLATNGEGTVGQLLNNPDLYNSLNDAAIRLERALAEAQLFIEKIKAEGVPLNF